ncbi:hypothetical protein [Brachybacterium alimentarium]|uniref:hypothetical protein n=1 Tax=Brachybacterium alimentarium TaxID=47845 RepID=UPI003FD5CE62
MKTDSFGITHRDSCTSPIWTVAIDRSNPRTHCQRCRACGIIWRPTDGALTARRPAGY